MSVDFEPNYMEVLKHPIILLNSDRKIIFFNNAASKISDVQIQHDLVKPIRDRSILNAVDEVLAKRNSRLLGRIGYGWGEPASG